MKTPPHFFENLVWIVKNTNYVSWTRNKDRRARTSFLISFVSWLRLVEEENVWFDISHLETAISLWKRFWELADVKDKEFANILSKYEELLKRRKELGEVGEFLVDLVSSKLQSPCCLTLAMEHENVPEWGAIIQDFRKLLNVSAYIKTGIFYLPPYGSLKKEWSQKENGEVFRKERYLKWNELKDELIQDMRSEIELNELEHSLPYNFYPFERQQSRSLWVLTLEESKRGCKSQRVRNLIPFDQRRLRIILFLK